VTLIRSFCTLDS